MKLSALLLLGNVALVASHGRMTSPPARQLGCQTSGSCGGSNSENGLVGGGPASVHSGGRYLHGLCGNAPSEAQQWALPGPITEVYTEGQSVTFDVVTTAHHMGFFEFQLCPSDDISEACFKQHQLLKSDCTGSDVACRKWWKPLVSTETGMWTSRAYPASAPVLPDAELAHVTPYKFRMNFDLPEGVSCSNCVVRWHYLTTNSCSGAHSKPEEFWNCADVRIESKEGAAATPATSVPPSQLSHLLAAPVDLRPSQDPLTDFWSCPANTPDSNTGEAHEYTCALGSSPGAACLSCNNDYACGDATTAIGPGQPTAAADVPTPGASPTAAPPTAAPPAGGEGTQCWTRQWSWPDDYCQLKPDCAQWERDYAYSQSWAACCEGHCMGAGTVSPEDTNADPEPTLPPSSPPSSPPASPPASSDASSASMAGGLLSWLTGSVASSSSSSSASSSSSCWKRQWSWPNDYCELKQSCEQWERDYHYSGSWEACCQGHCDGTGTVRPDNSDSNNNNNNNNNAPTTAAPAPTSAPPTAATPPATSPTAASTPNTQGSPKRMVAYVENWLTCPSDEQLAEYTHVIYSFAVTYTWTWSENLCNAQCVLNPVDACGGESIQAFLARAHQHGVKVLLSVGGAGMGGLWDLSKNRCWDTCWDEAGSLASQTVEQVNHFGFDGVDVDYEYLVETQQQQDFVVDYTLELRRLLPATALLTHAPMDYTLNHDQVYYQLLSRMGAALDFLMPQYYNGYTNVITSDSDVEQAMTHFGHLVHAMGGDESRVVFGFCLHDCGAWNASPARAAAVVDRLEQAYPSNGGVFFWAASGDSLGGWPRHVAQHQL